jgi:hypothetical protein
MESLKETHGASFEFAFGREKICSFSAGQTLQTLVLSQLKQQSGFQSLRLGSLDPEELLEREGHSHLG